MLTLLALPSGAYLAYLGYLLYNRTIPAWLGRHFRKLRKIQGPKGQEAYDALVKIGLFFFALSLYIVFSAFDLGFHDWGSPSWWPFFLFIALSIAGAVWIRHHLDTMWELQKQVQEQEKSDEGAIAAIKAHDPAVWYTEDDIEDVFPRAGEDDAQYAGVNVGGAAWLKFCKKGHIFTCGSARAGKGSCLLLPAILDSSLQLDNAPSFVVLDPRGENLAVAGDRLKEMGYSLVVLNPFGIAEIENFGSSRFNPFDLFSAEDKDFNKYVDLIRYAIIPQDPGQRHANSYFTEAASDMLSLYIRHMMTQDEEPKNIKTLYRWLRLSGEKQTNLFSKMEENDRFDISDDVSGIMQQLLQGGKSISDVMGNAITAMGSFKDDQIRESMSASDFQIKDISGQKTALFICVGAEDMQRMKPWMRIVVSAIMRGLARNFNTQRKVVLMLDEFTSMGAISEFENIQYLANYNVTAWLVMQDLNQIKALYPKNWENYVNNSIIRHWLRIGDNFTADYVSKRLGHTLVWMGKNPDGTPRYEKKPMLTPAEVQGFPDIIMEADGVKQPIRLKRKPYWEFVKPGGFAKNPFY